MATALMLRLHTRMTPAEELAGAIESFFLYCRAKNLSGSTIDYYRYRLDAFRKFLKKKELDLAPGDVTPHVLRDFLTYETEHNSPSTAHHSHITLRAFFRYLLRDGFIESNPMEGVEKVRRKSTVIDTFTPAQIEAMLATCGKDFVGVRDRAIMLVLLDCGLRVSELCGLCLVDIAWTENTLLVTGKGNKERVVPFGMAVRQALLAYIGRRGDLPAREVFVTTLGDGMDRYRVREVLQERGTTAKVTGVRCSPHTFRHTFAVMYLRNGGDVFSLQKLLGHTDLTMTRRYAELSQTDVVEKHRKFSPADSMPLAKAGKRERLR